MADKDEEGWPDKGLWIYPELLAKFLLFLLLDSGLAFILLALLWFKYGAVHFAVGGVAVGAIVIWRIVRSINRRDDPRANQPASDPESQSESGRPPTP